MIYRHTLSIAFQVDTRTPFADRIDDATLARALTEQVRDLRRAGTLSRAIEHVDTECSHGLRE